MTYSVILWKIRQRPTSGARFTIFQWSIFYVDLKFSNYENSSSGAFHRSNKVFKLSSAFPKDISRVYISKVSVALDVVLSASIFFSDSGFDLSVDLCGIRALKFLWAFLLHENRIPKKLRERESESIESKCSFILSLLNSLKRMRIQVSNFENLKFKMGNILKSQIRRDRYRRTFVSILIS